jgi:N-hydroxyarylamine O-acetyltransferase
MGSPLNIEAYCRRIRYDGSLAPTAATLRELQQHHLYSVPFENLDIGRRPIVIDEAAFIRKVVEERRGGFCYELNGAFSALLRSIGFEVMLISARVAHEDGGFGIEFDHLTLLVTADGERWLADVGFGESFVFPLRFIVDVDQSDPSGTFRIAQSRHAERSEASQLRSFASLRMTSGSDDFILVRNGKPEYRFALTPRTLDEFEPGCRYHTTSPQSSFTQKSVCSLATPAGRITLSGRKFIVTENGERTERDVTDVEWKSILRDNFGVTLPRGFESPAATSAG